MVLDFVVVDEDSPYQIILGRLFFRISKAVLSNLYLALKYRVNDVLGFVKGDQRIAGAIMKQQQKKQCKSPPWTLEEILKRVDMSQLRRSKQ